MLDHPRTTALLHREILTALLIVAFGASAPAQTTRMASVNSAGVHGNASSSDAHVSADGRYVGFDSSASNLVHGDTNFIDVFVRDRLAGTTERVSVDSNGAQAAGACSIDSNGSALSADGRFVVFVSAANNLVPGDTNGNFDVFVRDRLMGTTTRASVDSFGGQGDVGSSQASISADGTRVVFTSSATNLVPNDTNGNGDVFVHDMNSGATLRANLSSGGAQTNSESYGPAISADGRYVAFASVADNLVPNDTNDAVDVFVRDVVANVTTRVHVDSNGTQANAGAVYDHAIAISGDGRYVGFASPATNLVPNDTNGKIDEFVHDRQTGTTRRISVSSSGTQGDGISASGISISLDGRYVAFGSQATNLVSGDTNAHADVFVHDLETGMTSRVSVSSAGTESIGSSQFPTISADGRIVAFQSVAPALVHGDTNNFNDVFAHDRYATHFESMCDPSTDGVIACPCSNPAAGPGRGCDNSAGTGGASLLASGSAYLSVDELVFTTRNENPGALSVLEQASATSPSGVVFGQGVHCTSGPLLALYTKTAQGGKIVAPGASDPSVSARSATLGDAILPGQSRYYFVAYRETATLGACTAANAFNATQTGRVTWLP